MNFLIKKLTIKSNEVLIRWNEILIIEIRNGSKCFLRLQLGACGSTELNTRWASSGLSDCREVRSAGSGLGDNLVHDWRPLLLLRLLDWGSKPSANSSRTPPVCVTFCLNDKAADMDSGSSESIAGGIFHETKTTREGSPWSIK